MLPMSAKYESSINRFWEQDDDSSIPLRSVLVENQLEEEEADIAISHPFNATRASAERVLYDEIQGCIEILMNSKKNLTCYRTYMQRTKQIGKLWACKNPAAVLWMVGIPSVISYGLITSHVYLIEEVKNKVSALSPMLSHAIVSQDFFMQNYTNALASLHCKKMLIDSGVNSCIEKFSWTRQWLTTNGILGCSYTNAYLDLQTHGMHLIGRWRNFFRIAGNIACPPSICLQEAVCEAANQGLASINQLAKEDFIAKNALTTFIEYHAPEKAALETAVLDLQAQVDSSQQESTWSLTLSLFLLAAGLFSFGYVIYLYRDRNRAREDYEKGSHRLDQCLKPEHIPRIVNLTTQLEIAKDRSVEKLIEELEVWKSKEQTKESLFVLSTLLSQYHFPKEVIALILRIASDLIKAECSDE